MRKNRVKVVAFIGCITAILILNHHFGWSDYISDLEHLTFLEETVQDNLLFAFSIYIVITIVGCVVLALPGVTFALFAGILFGPWLGSFACLLATTVGASLAFLVGRFFLKDAVKPMLEKNKTLKKLLFSSDGKSDLIMLMITRMVPIFPYNLQNFAYGITDIGFWKYTIYTFVFMTPGVAFFTIGAAGLTAGEEKWKYFGIAGVLAVAVTLAGIAIQKRFLEKEKKAILIFTRVPVPGYTKTRLMPYLSGEECAKLHTRFIREIYRVCQNVEADTLVFYTPEDKAGILREIFGDKQRLFVQEGENLGEKMKHAFFRAFRMGYESCVLIGTDIPQIRERNLNEAFEQLKEYDIVINPTKDGGYYLIGMKKNYDAIWNVKHYGTNTVLHDTMEHIRKQNLSVCQGETLQDIDTKEDLLEVCGGQTETEPADCIHCGKCTRNCEFLRKYEMDLATFANRKELAYHCFLCGKCKEVCPKNIDGRKISLDMRAEVVRERGGKLPDQAYQGLMFEKNPYMFSNYKNGNQNSVLFMGCNFPAFFPKTAKCLAETLKEQGIGVVYDCCGKPVYEVGLGKGAITNVEKINEKCKAMGIIELIMVCPNCYYFLRGKLNVNIVSIYDKLDELHIGKKLEKEKIPMFYPCPDRQKKEMAAGIRKFLRESEEDAYSNVQCCGLGGCASCKEPEIAKHFTETAKKNEAGELYTYCASCISNFRRKGYTETYHVLPLILGVEEEMPGGIKPFLNRAKHKF